MAIGSPGKEQFATAIVSCRNRSIDAGVHPLIRFRQEVVNSDSLKDSGGLDTTTQEAFIRLLQDCDKWRRRVTYNPDSANLGDKIAKAIDPNAMIVQPENPVSYDDIQQQSLPLHHLPWSFDGTDVDFPLSSQLDMSGSYGVVLVGAIDMAIVAWTRLNSRERSYMITQADSLRIYTLYQQILELLKTFGGDENRVDIVQVRASDEPLGPASAPNRVTETVPAGSVAAK